MDASHPSGDLARALTVEEHLTWLLKSLSVIRLVVELSASPGRLPQFDDPADFRGFLDRRARDAHAHACAIKLALRPDVLNQEAPWRFMEPLTSFNADPRKEAR